MLHDCPQSSRSVTVAANNTDDPLAVRFGGRDEQWISGGTCVVNLRPLVQADAYPPPHKHVMVRAAT